ncbi:hypothetical protein ANCCAN_26272 [Ancylostoma caninum]|uniref:Uncharacterized protein n=1 Tax=Ancylostoma caninum TaxID=29170 RepID=A0A368F770_ANCCA|nr:hypothetical protein ANCCAN_26272 [Ancylostoma caninum]
MESANFIQTERPTALRPAETVVGGGEFTGNTTNKTDYDMKQDQRVTAFRPVEIVIGAGEFSGKTTNRADFDRKEVSWKSQN